MADHEIDGLIECYRESEDLKEITQLSHKLIQKIHDHGAYVPGWVRPWYRVGQWRWVNILGLQRARESRAVRIPHPLDRFEEKARAQGDGGWQASGTASIRVFDKYKLLTCPAPHQITCLRYTTSSRRSTLMPVN